MLDLRNFELSKSCFAFGDRHHVSINDTTESLTKIISKIETYLQTKGHTNLMICEIEPEIEDCFMQLSQKQ